MADVLPAVPPRATEEMHAPLRGEGKGASKVLSLEGSRRGKEANEELVAVLSLFLA
jgi:hypothetical protein